MVLLREHRGPLSADFRRFYQCNLVDALAGDVAPLSDVCAWAANLPPESATLRAANPNWQHTPELEVSRSSEFSLRLLLWQNQNEGLSRGKQSKQPEPFYFPWEDQPKGDGWRGDSLDWDEAADLLGGDDRLRRLMAA